MLAGFAADLLGFQVGCRLCAIVEAHLSAAKGGCYPRSKCGAVGAGILRAPRCRRWELRKGDERLRVLVTGGGGFIGRNLVRALAISGASVIAVDNYITSSSDDSRALAGLPGVEVMEADCSTADFAARVESLEFDRIFHLACPTGVPNLQRLAFEMLAACYDGSRVLLEAARMRGVPVLLASSAEVYGNPLVSPQAESYSGNVDQLGPRKAYEEGKRIAETLFALYAEKYRVPAKIARIFNTYGPGMAMSDTRVIPSFVRSALVGEDILVHGDGSQTRCHTFVEDLVRGLRLVLDHGEPARAYNLGTPKPMTVDNLAREVVRVAESSSRIRYIDRPAHDHDKRLPDTSRARSELGWVPAVSLSDGLKATITDFKSRLGA